MTFAPEARSFVFTAPLRPLARPLLALLALQLAGNVLLFVAAYRELTLIDRITSNPAAVAQNEVDSADRLFGTTRLILLVLLVATAALMATWLYRARRNVEQWEPEFSRRGPGWAIGGWVCPLLNLWVPYLVVRDTWDDSDGRGRPRPLLALWWASYLIVMPFYGAITWAPAVLAFFTVGGDDFDGRGAYQLSVLTAFLAVLSLLLTMLTVLGLTASQERRRARAYAALRS